MKLITRLLDIYVEKGFEDDEIRRISTLYYFLFLAIGIFTTGGIIDFLVIDLRAIPFWIFPFYVSLTIAIFLSLRMGANYQVMTQLTIFMNYICIQLVFWINPTSYHVIVYWVSILPLLTVITSEWGKAKFWTILVFLTIIINGLHVHFFIQRSYEIFPSNYAVGGILFGLTIYFLSSYFNHLQQTGQDELQRKNEELIELKNEIEAQNNQLVKQRDILSDQKNFIESQNKQLETLNELLEEKVMERTKVLETKNKQLAEYAYINSHLLRAPLSRILGLIDLMTKSDISEKEKDLINHLKNSGNELDVIIKKINIILEKGHYLDRDALNSEIES